MAAEIHVEGLEDIERALERLPRWFNLAGRALGDELLTRMATYPPPPKYPLRWASRQQKFYVTKVLRRNLGPYVRMYDPMSQDLLHSWTVDTKRLPHEVIVGTRVSYAPYVQSDAMQQPFHADTGWITDKRAVEDLQASGVVNDVIQDALDAVLKS